MACAHLLAFPTDPARCSQREAQAMVLENAIALELANEPSQPGAKVHLIVLGDMNDYDGQLDDAASDVPVSRVLEILRQVTIDGEVENLGSQAPPNTRYSNWRSAEEAKHTGGAQQTAIDHILASHGIVSS